MGCLQFQGDAPYTCDTLELELTNVFSRLVGGYRVWDAEVKVTAFHEGTTPAEWDRLGVSLRSAPGEARIPILPYRGTHPERRAVDIYYLDLYGKPDVAGPGDVLYLFGLSRAFQGTNLRIRVEALRVASLDLPRAWNETLSVHLGAPSVTVPTEYYNEWSVKVDVQAIEPSSERVPWDDVSVGLIDHGHLDANLTRVVPNEGGLNFTNLLYDILGGVNASSDVAVGDALSARVGYWPNPEGRDLMLLTGTAVLGFVRLPVDFPETPG